MKVAVYARVSTDRQNEDSPDDQIARCRDFANRKGWHVVEELIEAERGISGATRHNRPGLLRLLARVRDFDLLLCWDFSRLSRDGEDAGYIRNVLKAANRTAIEVSTGLDVFNVGAKVLGIFAEEYLVKLSADTRRGLQGRVERGLSAGGTPYGYRTEAVGGEGDGRRLVIDEAQADVVRRIFEAYIAGASLREIAHQLNAEGVPAPRPRGMKHECAPAWVHTSMREMLRNPIYKGERIWDQSRWVKDRTRLTKHGNVPRVRHARPESEWLRESRPDLAIVTPETWAMTQEAARGRALGWPRSSDGRRIDGHKIAGPSGSVQAKRALLSGLLACADCGGAFGTTNRTTHYGCGRRRDRGPTVCGNDLRVRRVDVEERVLGLLREQLDSETVLYVIRTTMEAARLARVGSDPDADQHRLAQLDAKRERLVRMAADGQGIDDVVGKVLAEVRQERDAILSRLNATPLSIDPSTWAPWIDDRLTGLRNTLDAATDGGRSVVRELLDGERFRISPDADRTFRIEGEIVLTVSPPPLAGVGGHSGSGGGI